MQLARECDEYREWVNNQIGPLWEQLEHWWNKCYLTEEDHAHITKSDPSKPLTLCVI